MITLNASQRLQVEAIVQDLKVREAIPEAKRRLLNEAYFRRAFGAMLGTGATLGEATGGRGIISPTTDHVVFRARLRQADNDLGTLLRIVREGIEDYFLHGQWPAPYYAYRVAVILRKAKECRLEADFCQAFSRHFARGPGSRYAEIKQRSIKARALARGQGR